MARPRKQVDVAEVLKLRLQGLSWPAISRKMRLGVGTVHRAHRKATDAVMPVAQTSASSAEETGLDAPQPFQNPSAAILQAGPNQEIPELRTPPPTRRLYRPTQDSRTAAPARNVSSTRLTGLERASFRN